MKLEYTHLLPEDFNDNSRVWIYQSNRLFTLHEALDLEHILEEFLKQWKSHGATVKGFATLFFGQFVILMADESVSEVSGCSTDGSVRMLKSVEEKFKVNLFDRTNLAFWIKEKVQLLPMTQLEFAINQRFIDGKTLFFNNTVTNKSDLKYNWIIPISKSWISKRYEIELL